MPLVFHQYLTLNCFNSVCCSDDQKLTPNISLIFMSILKTYRRDKNQTRPLASDKLFPLVRPIDTFKLANNVCLMQRSGGTPDQYVFMRITTKNFFRNLFKTVKFNSTFVVRTSKSIVCSYCDPFLHRRATHTSRSEDTYTTFPYVLPESLC